MIKHPQCQGRECGTWEQCTGNPCVPVEADEISTEEE